MMIVSVLGSDGGLNWNASKWPTTPQSNQTKPNIRIAYPTTAPGGGEGTLVELGSGEVALLIRGDGKSGRAACAPPPGGNSSVTSAPRTGAIRLRQQSSTMGSSEPTHSSLPSQC